LFCHPTIDVLTAKPIDWQELFHNRRKCKKMTSTTLVRE